MSVYDCDGGQVNLQRLSKEGLHVRASSGSPSFTNQVGWGPLHLLLYCMVMVANFHDIQQFLALVELLVCNNSDFFFFFTCFPLTRKLSVAVCISFFAAWSPYAVVSMWAAFGHIDNIPPLAFAMPAMFAKSSTIYNPIIYLTLRPNIRRVMCRDLGILCHSCLKGCHWVPAKCCTQPELRVRLGNIHKRTNQMPKSDSFAQPSIVALKDHSCENCKDTFECFKHYPQICGFTHPSASEDQGKDEDESKHSQAQRLNTRRVGHRRSLLAAVCSERTLETENLHVNFEMMPVQTRVAWPWKFSNLIITQFLYNWMCFWLWFYHDSFRRSCSGMCQDIPVYPYTFIFSFVNSLCPFIDFSLVLFLFFKKKQQKQIQHGRIAVLAIWYGRIATRQTV